MQNYYDEFEYSLDDPRSNYRLMLMIRLFEEKLLSEFAKGNISGTTHTCIGQEANAISIVNNLEKDHDVIWSNHRCHGHFLAYTGDAFRLFAEILGKPAGVCSGRGGSQHLAWNNFYSSGVQGGLAPLAVGTAFGYKDKGAISAVFLGDGTMGEGSIYEAMNLASLWNCPVLFIVEDNAIAQTTPKSLALSGDIKARGEAFGIQSRSLATTDLNELMPVAQQAIDYVRSEKRPYWLHIQTTRLAAHSKGDDTRPRDEVDDMKKRDCLALLSGDFEKEEIYQEVERFIEESFEAARVS